MEIIDKYPRMRFAPTGYFAFDAATEVIHYDPKRINSKIGRLSLLHEISHALLGHFHYDYDLELLSMELAAWQRTQELAQKHSISYDNQYADSCIESYDAWVQQRATCPECEQFSSQIADDEYRCFACTTRWKVAGELNERVIRRVIKK